MTAPADTGDWPGWGATIRHALRGAWLLACFDPRAVDYFPPSRRAAILSFVAVPLSLPFHIAARWEEIPRLKQLGMIPAKVPDGIVLFNELWLLILSICLPPVVIYEIARRMDRKSEYLTWLGGWNWCGLLISPAMAAADLLSHLLQHIGFYSEQQGNLFMFIMSCLAITYVWIGFHLLLRVGSWAATALTIFSLVGFQMVLRMQLWLYTSWV